MTKMRSLHFSKHLLLITLGWVCIVAGVIGIFLPVLPTTPFILLAAWAFSRSSERFHRWLLTHRHLGPIVHGWESGEGIPRRVRNRIILLIWISLVCSTVIMGVMGYWWLAPVMALIGIAATAYMLRQPVAQD